MDIGYGHTRRSGRSGTEAPHYYFGKALTVQWLREPTSVAKLEWGRRSRSGIVAEDVARAIRPRPGALSAPVCGDSVKRRRRAGKLRGRRWRETNICNSRTSCRSHDDAEENDEGSK